MHGLPVDSIDLLTFDNDWYKPGRHSVWVALWFLLGSPLLRCRINPSSSFRRLLLKVFGATIGDGVVLKPGVRVKYPWRLSVGANSWIGEDCWIDNLEQVTIGRNACLSQGAYVCTGNHDWSDPAFGLIVKPVLIRDCAWVGAKCFVGPGVEIGVGAVLTAGSFATESIPAFEIHRGNPARFTRLRILRTGEKPESKGLRVQCSSATTISS